MRIDYGTLSASGAVGNCKLSLVDVHRLRLGAEDFSVSFDVLLSTPTRSGADFGAACLAVEQGYRREFQDLLVAWVDPAGALSDVALLSLKHSDATGLEIRGEIEKAGDPRFDTALSRRYTVTISGDLPPHSSLLGRRSETYDLSKDGSCRRTLTVTGTYTSTAATASVAANAEARLAAKSAALLLTLGGADKWKLVDSRLSEVSENDQLATYTQEWLELIYADNAATFNDERLGRSELKVDRSLRATEGDPSERALGLVTASYSAEVCKDQTVDLKALYEAEIQPWIVSNMRLVSPGSFFALVVDRMGLDRSGNKIEAHLEAYSTTGGEILELRRTEILDVQHGALIDDVWDEATVIETEDPTPAYVYPGPKQVTFTEELRRTVVGKGTSLRPASAGGGGGAGGGGFALNLAGPFQGFLGVGVISSPGESFLSFLGPEGSAFSGAGAGGVGGAGTPGVVRGIPVSTQHRLEPGSRGIPGYQFEVSTQVTTRVTRYVKGVPSSGGVQPAANTTRTR